MDNKSIIKQLKLTAALMELHDENVFKIRGYNSAVFNLDKTDIELGSLSFEDLQSLDGVGKGIATAIDEINQTGSSAQLLQYLEDTPEGIVELLNLKGIGPKKIKVLWKELGIESGHELKEAANTGKVAQLKGFGEKTQETIIKALEYKEANAHKLHFAEAEILTQEIVEGLKELLPEILIHEIGAVRRNLETIENIEILLGLNNFDQAEILINKNESYNQNIKTSGPVVWRGLYKEHKIPVCLTFCTKDKFITDLFINSGSVKHINTPVKGTESLRDIALSKAYTDEKSIYLAAGMDFVEPELREGLFEIEAAKNHTLPKLVEMSDLKGILHNHSTYSDGKHSLEQMAQRCKDMGYEYLGICDHSKSAFYANGLDENRIMTQHAEIDKLNAQMAPFKIYKGIESDILFDGNLDYDNEVLASFDFIVASVHSVLNMKKEKATTRLLTAIENPYTTILGHPTGRLLLRREGYPIDHKRVIDHCAKHNVVIEINANPWRLDLDWRWVHYAIEQGVKLSINPDAHEMDGYKHMYYGLLAGRKGGLTAEMTFNNLSNEEIGKFFMARKEKISSNV